MTDTVRHITIYPEGKRWFLPRQEVDGVVHVLEAEVDEDGNVVYNMTADLIDGTNRDLTNQSFLARLLRRIWYALHGRPK